MNDNFKKYITIIYTAIITLLIMCVFVWACDDFYFGKSQEDIEKEIYESMFEIDTTIGRIKIMLGDSSSVNK
ncbi:MAG: hypothetical protein Tp1111SUR768151_1 [Prokaryotic dsDNA virus sp.]|nr:MAG: hypothetical protein Tp1111SUR768151_1 [Prokaryotic dsDNA virus sp.]